MHAHYIVRASILHDGSERPQADRISAGVNDERRKRSTHTLIRSYPSLLPLPSTLFPRLTVSLLAFSHSFPLLLGGAASLPAGPTVPIRSRSSTRYCQPRTSTHSVINLHTTIPPCSSLPPVHPLFSGIATLPRVCSAYFNK